MNDRRDLECKYCGTLVKNVSDDAATVTCTMCTMKLLDNKTLIEHEVKKKEK